MGSDSTPVLDQAFRESLKPTINSMVKDTLAKVDYLFISDWHTQDTQMQWVARPDVMRGFAEGGVKVIDLEVLPPELVHIAGLYHNNQISRETMEFFVSDLYGSSNHQSDNVGEMTEVASIIAQAKDYGIEVTSTNSHFPKYSRQEFEIWSAHQVGLIDVQAKAFDALDISSMNMVEKRRVLFDSEAQFKRENPDLVSAHDALVQMQKERFSQIVALQEGAVAARLKEMPEGVAEKVQAFIVEMGEKGEFIPKDFEALDPDVKEIMHMIFDKSYMKMRFDDDANLAASMEENRGEGKMVAVLGSAHFDREPVMERYHHVKKGWQSRIDDSVSLDVDHSLGESRTAVMRIFNDRDAYAGSLTAEYKKMQALYNYDMSDAPDITLDMSRGTWTDKKGNVTEVNLAVPLSDQPAVSKPLSPLEDLVTPIDSAQKPR